MQRPDPTPRTPVRPGTPVPDPGFAGDEGGADPRLAAALAAWSRDPAHEPEVLRALAAARVLVPVVAVATGVEDAGGGLHREAGTDMAVVVLEGTDGRRALPVFTGLASLAAYDPAARPVPVEAARAALAAAAEGAPVVVVDVAGPVRYVVPSAALRRLAEGDPLLPLYDDPAALAALGALLAEEPAVVAAWVGPVGGSDARLSLAVADPSDAAAVRALAARLGGRLREDPAVRARVLRGVEVALVGAAPPGARPVARRTDP
ncbi:SseB family protein [Vallicoccus soli]|uniref:SseB family protein n=1 Tax=Vallicoccus soli TaxID=2339232 RepID=A0A3A3YY74_9ACTN|nr:SseB family protein [Vallicoccus soli]RJK96710.1 SseB family protein [Vallicoccus soli]